MVDWQGLFNWSTQYHDGTSATRPDFAPMTKEDKEWLAAAMQEYTFNDADRLKEVCKEFRNDVESEYKTEYDKTCELLEEFQDIIEIHERNSLNLAMCGGLEDLLNYMLKHPDARARIIAC